MKILFVENREMTRLFELIAERLASNGHRISWIVQNHRFAPARAARADVHCIPFPAKHQLQPLPAPSRYSWVSQSDRGIRHFGGNADHYLYYETCIEQILDGEQPDVVFGESTQFHELITIELCRTRGIRYLFPTATRIPRGRVLFLKGNTLDPLGGEGITLPTAEARDILNAVAERRCTAYTPAEATAAVKPRLDALMHNVANRMTIVRSWLDGERYVTPSPLRKSQLEWRKRSALKKLQRLSNPKLAEGVLPQSYVLYPMQMQPENTLDVWGQPWNSQARIIRAAARSLVASGHQLIVKLNPTAKYELLEPGLFETLREPNVTLAPPGTPMAQLLNGAAAILSVTGSVIYEAVFSGKTVCVLGNHSMAKLPGVIALSRPEDLGIALNRLNNRPDIERCAHDALQLVMRTSYPGYWFDPFTMGEFNTRENLDALAAAFEHVMVVHESEPAQGQNSTSTSCAPTGI